MFLGWRWPVSRRSTSGSGICILHASCGSQTHVYNDTPFDGGTQQTGQETRRTDARAGALCILSENMPD